MPLTMPSPSASSGQKYELVPADSHAGVCIGVIDLGTHTESFQGQAPRSVHKVKFVFELPDVEREDGSTAIISKTLNLSMHEKSNFRKTIEGWLGAEAAGKLVGQSLEGFLEIPGLVNVQHGQSKDTPPRTFAFIAGISPIPKRMTAPKPTRSTHFLDLDNKTLPAELGVWDAETIRNSDEYRAGGFKDEAPTPKDQGRPSYTASKDAAVRFVPGPADGPEVDEH